VHNSCKKENKTENHNGHLVGQNGTQTPSHTIWQNGKTERVDVENHLPGKIEGNVHYHDRKNKKYIYRIDENQFYDYKTKEVAPKSIQKLLEIPQIARAIKKGKKYLGEE